MIRVGVYLTPIWIVVDRKENFKNFLGNKTKNLQSESWKNYQTTLILNDAYYYVSCSKFSFSFYWGSSVGPTQWVVLKDKFRFLLDFL